VEREFAESPILATRETTGPFGDAKDDRSPDEPIVNHGWQMGSFFFLSAGQAAVERLDSNCIAMVWKRAWRGRENSVG
jgi:hypothetical protein